MEAKKKVITLLKLISVEPYLFLTSLGIVMSMVPLQSLLIDRACRNILEYPRDICDAIDHHKEQQEKSIELGNNLYTAVMIVNSLPSVLVAIFVGPWSDKYSRKWPLVLAAIGLLLESLALVFLTIEDSVSPWWFVCASVISGLTGGFLICLSASGSYISDITDERSRSTRFAFLDFFFTSANVVGNLLSGMIFKKYGYLTVLCVAPCLYLTALIYACAVVKETKPAIPAGKRSEVFRDLLTVDNIKQSYHTCTKKRAGNIRLQIWLLIFVDTSAKFVVLGTLAIGFSFAKQMFKMGVTKFNYVNSVSSIINALVTVLLVPIFTKKLKLHEAAVGFIGMMSLMSKMVLSSVSYTLPIFYFALSSGTLWNCITIAVQSRLSKLVGKEELGRAFSLLGTFSAVAPMLGTAAFFQVYNTSLSYFPGLAYASASVFLLPSAVILGWMMKLPTISVGDYARNDEESKSVPLPSIYTKLEEDEHSFTQEKPARSNKECF